MEEKLIKEWLDKNDIFYYSLIYTKCYSGVLSISFCQDIDLNNFLELIKYRSMFNKSRYLIIKENKTVICYGDAATDIIKLIP